MVYSAPHYALIDIERGTVFDYTEPGDTSEASRKALLQRAARTQYVGETVGLALVSPVVLELIEDEEVPDDGDGS